MYLPLLFTEKKDVVVSSQLVEYQHMEIAGSRLFQLENSGHGIVDDELERFNDLFFCLRWKGKNKLFYKNRQPSLTRYLPVFTVHTSWGIFSD